MANASRSMRCYLKGTSSSPIIQFSSNQDNQNDTGDGGGVPVFTFLSISSFGMPLFEASIMFGPDQIFLTVVLMISEKMAEELVQMLKSEISLKVSCQSIMEHLPFFSK